MSQNIGMCVVLLNSQGQILLGKRKNSYRAGWFGLPGGRLEFEETVLEGAARELLEETGVRSVRLDFLTTIRDGQGDYDFIHFVFVCREFSGIPACTEPDKCEGWDWFDLENLPSPILRGHAVAIEAYRQSKLGKLNPLMDYPKPE